MSSFNPVNGCMALQLWSGAIAAVDRSQISGYGLITSHLAGLLEQAGGDREQVGVVRSGAPVEVSAVIRSLENTPTGEAMGALVHDRFVRRLVSQSYHLQRLVSGENHPSSSVASFYRISVMDALQETFVDSVPGRGAWEKKANAGIRAALAANETQSYADRYLAARAMDPSSPRLPVLLNQIRQEIRDKARPQLVNDMLAALEMYLEVSERASKT